jgi:hypothetical protein
VPWRSRIKPSATTALCVVAARLSFPGRWYGLADFFSKSPSWLSSVFVDACQFLAGKWGEVLRWHPSLTYERLKAFEAGVICAGGSPRIWGFVDGTFRGFCRPSGGFEEQLAAYSGHKKAHGMVWQAVVTPDGLVSSLAGPYLGPTNDYGMYCRSGLGDRLREVMGPHEVLYLYGDPAYRLVFGVMSPFRAAAGGRRQSLPPAQKAFNRRLASVRIAVENSFGETQQQWTYTHFAEGLRPGFQPVAAFYATAILLQNCRTCIRGGSPISRRFGVPPQSVEAYLLYSN